jgi:hypothetical protein
MSGYNIVGFDVLCVFPMVLWTSVFKEEVLKRQSRSSVYSQQEASRSNSFWRESILVRYIFGSFDSTHSTNHTSTTECVESS